MPEVHTHPPTYTHTHTRAHTHTLTHAHVHTHCTALSVVCNPPVKHMARPDDSRLVEGIGLIPDLKALDGAGGQDGQDLADLLYG